MPAPDAHDPPGSTPSLPPPPLPAPAGEPDADSFERTLSRSPIFLALKALAIMARSELGSRARVPLLRRLRLLRHGFRGDADAFYDLAGGELHEYLGDWASRVPARRINTYYEYLNHKLATRAFLLAMGFPQPETMAIAAGSRCLLHPFGPDARPADLAGLEQALRADGDEYVVKPNEAVGGAGIYLLEVRDGALIQRRGRSVGPWSAAQLEGRFRLVERRLRQAEFWRALYPGSANTLRVLTLWTPGEPRPFIARAIQRIGTRETDPTDNWTGGGIAARIDLASGRLSEGRTNPLKGAHRGQRFTHHPDTGERIEGAVLPHWERIAETALKAAVRFPYNPSIGWDILVDEAGTPVIIEANGNSGVNLLQVHGGLLADPAIREFYEKVGVI